MLTTSNCVSSRAAPASGRRTESLYFFVNCLKDQNVVFANRCFKIRVCPFPDHLRTDSFSRHRCRCFWLWQGLWFRSLDLTTELNRHVFHQQHQHPYHWCLQRHSFLWSCVFSLCLRRFAVSRHRCVSAPAAIHQNHCQNSPPDIDKRRNNGIRNTAVPWHSVNPCVSFSIFTVQFYGCPPDASDSRRARSTERVPSSADETTHLKTKMQDSKTLAL